MNSETEAEPHEAPTPAPPSVSRPAFGRLFETACDWRPFARIFETDDFGQILVTLGQADDGAPEVRWTIQPPGLAPCAVGVAFVDTADGETKARALFEAMDEAGARRAAQDLLNDLAELRLLAEPVPHEIG